MTPLLLLHGALGAEDQMLPLKAKLEGQRPVFTMSFSGHGGNPVTHSPYRMKHFAFDVLSWLAENDLEKIDIFGYSMGGFVGMYLARHYPEKVGKVFTLATKYVWDTESTSRELRMLNAEKIKEKVPKFAAFLEMRHSPQDWEVILSKTAEMMQNLSDEPVFSDEDYAALEHEIMIAVGDKDSTAGVEDTISTFRKLQNAQLLVIPKTPHPFERVNLDFLSQQINQFFTD